MAFLARTTSAAEWKTVAAAIAAIVEEASFEATPTGLGFRAMDPSHVALVDLSWPTASFEKYECDKQINFTVRVEDLVKFLRRAEAKDSVEITLGEEGFLLLRLADGYKKEYQLHLIEATYTPTPLPKLAFNSRFMTTEESFERILGDVAAISDHVTIEASKESIVFRGKSDMGAATITLEKGSADLLELDVKENSKATYSIDFLTSITKAAGAGSQTTMCEYSTKMPLRLEFKLGELGGKIHFFLAPRIDERG